MINLKQSIVVGIMAIVLAVLFGAQFEHARAGVNSPQFLQAVEVARGPYNPDNVVCPMCGNLVGSTIFPQGNMNVVTTSNDWFDEDGGNRFFRNTNGTYSTITYAPTISSSGTDFGSSSCGGSLVCASDNAGPSYSCPGGTTLYNNMCYPNEYCSTTSSGKGSSTSCAVPTGEAPSGHYEQQCTSSGKGGQSCQQVWVPETPSSSARVTNAPSTPPAVQITATPSIVRLGGESRVSWDGGSADECSVSGPSLSAATVVGSQVVTNIQEQSTYTLTCSRGTAVAQDTTRIDIVPLWREF